MGDLGYLLGQQSLDPVGPRPPVDAGPALRVVELTLTSGTWYTLRLPDWDRVDGESAPLLAYEGELYVFGTPTELLEWCATATRHELATSPAWADRDRLTTDVADDDRFDLTSPVVPADGPVERDDLPELGRLAVLVDDLVVALELESPAVDALDASQEFADLLEGGPHLDGLLDGGRRERLADALRAGWDPVVRMVAQRLRVPETEDAAAVHPDGSSAATAGPSRAAAALEDLAAVETVWLGLPDLGVYTVRAAPPPDDGPLYLGSAGTLVGAGDIDALRAWLARDEPTDLSQVAGWASVVSSPDVDLEPYDECVVDLAEAGQSLTEDLTGEGCRHVVDAWLLIAELADWGGWTEVSACLEADRPVGRFLSGVLPELSSGDPTGRRRLRELDLGELREAWAEMLDLVIANIGLVG